MSTILNIPVAADGDDAYTYNAAARDDRDYVYVNFLSASCYGGFRFLNVTVPNGATIDTAYLTVVGYNSSNVILTDIYGEDVDDSTIIEGGTLLDNRTLTTATVNWSATIAVDVSANSPEIKSIIQEIVDRPQWASGNSICIICKKLEGAGSAAFYDYQVSTSNCAILHIEYTPAGSSGGSNIIPQLIVMGQV